jgi:hypothetical protein
MSAQSRATARATTAEAVRPPAPTGDAPRLRDFRPAAHNANTHTPRGLGLLDQSLSEDGYVAPMTATADGEVIDGSARLERVAERFGPDVEPIVIEHDGTRPIIAKRIDIPHANTPIARRIALRANRVAQLDLAWNTDELTRLAQELPDVTHALWSPEEWHALVNGDTAPPDDPQRYHSTDSQLGALQYSVIVDCADEQDQAALLAQLEQDGRSCRALIS